MGTADGGGARETLEALASARRRGLAREVAAWLAHSGKWWLLPLLLLLLLAGLFAVASSSAVAPFLYALF